MPSSSAASLDSSGIAGSAGCWSTSSPCSSTSLEGTLSWPSSRSLSLGGWSPSTKAPSAMLACFRAPVFRGDGAQETSSDRYSTTGTVIVKWWKVVNVKTPRTGDCLRDKCQEPVFSLDGPKINFLYKLLDWLELCKERTMSYDSGKLMKGTHTTLPQTTQGFNEFTTYSFGELKLSYALPWKIQNHS
ncbi:hypothetical protein HPB49_021835 [Dermacentor silvarum]|uniref:Uncharacterized protein n=1 Tax=Dermacentor silvarum TaxID=543639 RepID=A0ACB8CBK2_DERSI|nr:hypothetical protein HPB49_021835 [Dermacentor silvarum]